MKTYLSFFSVVILIFSIVSCQPKDTFAWNAGWSAPKYYGAAPFLEYFYKGKSVAGTSANIGADPGWGITSGGYTGGDKYKNVPDSISVKWLCSTDGYYYEGGGKLPREKMLNLFKEKIIDPYTKQKTDYCTIVAGMAPGGNVTIWMRGAGVNTEITKFKVKNRRIWNENDKDYQEREKKIASSKEFINSEANIFRNLHGVPYSVWEKGEKLYNYDIGFSSGMDNKFTETIRPISKDGSYIFFNQDEFIISYKDWQNNSLKSNKKKIDKLPVHTIMQWISPDKKDWYKGEIVFPINFKASFEEFYAKYKEANIVFVMDKIDSSQDFTFGNIWLQSPLAKKKIMKFRLAKFNFDTKTYNVSKYSLPKGFIFPKWEGREQLTFPELDYWQEK